MDGNWDAIYRLGVFVSVLFAMASLEFILPKRQLKTSRVRRWFTNITIAGLNNVFVRLMGFIALPVVALSTALYAEESKIGLFYFLDLPLWLSCILSIILLDLAIYFQHVASHHIPFLWRLHKVHHADTDIDVTTAVRFHPVEIVLSMLYKVALVLFFGVPVLAVFLFEMILNACAMFNHANVNLPKGLDRVLRLFIVTPDMHRVHHSVREVETNSNYGFNIPLWDYVFGTYTSQPRDGHEGMTIGLESYQTPKPTQIFWSLSLPFRSIRNAKASQDIKVQEESSGE